MSHELTAYLSILNLFFISSNIYEVLSINPSANVFVCGDFNIHHKDWLTCSGGTDRPGGLNGELSYSDPRLWLSVSCSFGFIYFFWC